jgi:hypothetical protein
MPHYWSAGKRILALSAKKKPSRIGAAWMLYEITDDSGGFLRGFFKGDINFGEGVRVVVQAFRAFKRGKIGADGNGGEVFGQALVIADSTFKRTVRIHSNLLFVPVVVDLRFFVRFMTALNKRQWQGVVSIKRPF